MEHSPEELLDLVVDQTSFIRFVEALAEERTEAKAIEAANPQRYCVDGAHNWKNAEIDNFLEGCLDYFTPKPVHTPEQTPSWRMFAEFLYHGKIIE